ncbi:MAG: hypothetical protein DRH79_04440 [Candidatus Cloacimonadota bacterium]|nr:MAG: hypothetical protein DRH79_04440 [Candidatus Cloacimonadota bacterium]
MKKMITLIIIVLITSTLLAEIEFEKGFGISAGMTCGSGASYRYVNEEYGFQTTYGGGTGNKNTLQYIGLQFIKPIHSVPKTRFNLVGGLGIFTSYEDNHLDDMSYSIGIGPEVEITFSGNMRFIIGSPFTVVLHYDDDSRLASFMPTMSLIYFFK